MYCKIGKQYVNIFVPFISTSVWTSSVAKVTLQLLCGNENSRIQPHSGGNGFLATLIGGIKVVLRTLITADQVPAASSAIAHSGSLYR